MEQVEWLHAASARWWPLCLAEQVVASQPAAMRWGRLELAVYRDSANRVRVVEDRCPHRRAPLSLGRTTAEGNIQCGYHGWIFNGESGELSGFPNLDPGERLPRCNIRTYPTKERGGFVYVWIGEGEPGVFDDVEPPAANPDGREYYGRAMQALTHPECVAALLDSPGMVMRYLGVEFLDKPLGDPQIDGGLLVTNRAARWNLVGESALYVGPLRHRADFPLRLQTHTAPVTGQTTACLYAGEDALLARVRLAAVPAARNMTTINWRATVFPKAHGKLAPLMSVLCKLGISPVRLPDGLDCDALAAVLPGPGREWQAMRDGQGSAAIRAIHETGSTGMGRTMS